jgi:hypothetical protein
MTEGEAGEQEDKTGKLEDGRDGFEEVDGERDGREGCAEARGGGGGIEVDGKAVVEGAELGMRVLVKTQKAYPAHRFVLQADWSCGL